MGVVYSMTVVGVVYMTVVVVGVVVYTMMVVVMLETSYKIRPPMYNLSHKKTKHIHPHSYRTRSDTKKGTCSFCRNI